ncbi:MAG: polysaccharide pyruvyl transferase family protein [Bacteroidales bacterium]|nr:polysaccharide pyruvyl transferase family protein [Bacteroidales bacterium]
MESKKAERIRVGILTFHRAHNFGALLQAYALLSFLQKYFPETEIIDYWPSYHQDEYTLIPNWKKRTFVEKIKGILVFLLGFPKILKRRAGYLNFMKEYLHVSDKVRYPVAGALAHCSYDVVIYGSDQIWRKMHFNNQYFFDDVYWGLYPHNVGVKIAYAASMGDVNLTPDDIPYIRQSVQNFRYIGIREDYLINKLRQIIEADYQQVVDPIFLLDKQNWENIIDQAAFKIPNEKYILFYHLSFNNSALQFVNRLARITGYRIIEIRGRVIPYLMGKRYFHGVSPLQFLALIRNSEIVVTNSFHGTAFSVLFEKSFYSVLKPVENSRIKSLLKMLNLENRIVVDEGVALLEEPINYSQVKRMLSHYIQNSKDFVLRSVQNTTILS